MCCNKGDKNNKNKSTNQIDKNSITKIDKNVAKKGAAKPKDQNSPKNGHATPKHQKSDGSIKSMNKQVSNEKLEPEEEVFKRSPYPEYRIRKYRPFVEVNNVRILTSSPQFCLPLI